jgi:hypothetical protein
MIFGGLLLHAQQDVSLELVNKFITSAEEEGLSLKAKEKCDRPPGEMCRLPYQITPDIHNLDIIVIGNKRSKPSLAVEDASAHHVITFTMEEEVANHDRVNFVRKSFSLKGSDINVVLYYGNTRSFGTENTYMLIFEK